MLIVGGVCIYIYIYMECIWVVRMTQKLTRVRSFGYYFGGDSRN